jgi:aerotaxis receptor
MHDTLIQNEQRETELTKIEPINEESAFGLEELFVSVTDPSSVIQFANDVFLRVAKYERQEILGKYHNIIRHPDMPMAAFRVMWEYLLNGAPVCVYVKNMAKDGSYYWVLALAFPVPGGYLSIRMKPGSKQFDKIKAIYKETRKYELELLTKHDREYSVRAGKTYLIEKIKELGYHSYGAFMKYSLQMEMRHREESLNQRQPSDRVLTETGKKLQRLSNILRNFVLAADGLDEMHNDLIKHSNFILHLSNSIYSIAINARLQSSKLDKSDQSLSVISEKMGEQTQWGEENLKKIIHKIEDLYRKFRKLNFDVVSTKLQTEMALFYEIQYNSKDRDSLTMLDTESFEKIIELLTHSIAPRNQEIINLVSEIPELQSEIQGSIRDIDRYLTILRFIYITGKVEITRMVQRDESFQQTFEDLIKELEVADTHLANLRKILHDNSTLIARYIDQSAHLRDVSLTN